ncbi:YqzL family protein [Pullulanibacillus sp. KACC 23026]|nr:YqzL family protein [Pullulanibacillus sp. KACC 23026]WEG14241.1 YqzL family protein [Pullulanibacillus sp. KACC 23026]
MLDFTWKVFCMTGNIDTYLLYKELTDEGDEIEETDQEHFSDQPIH